MSSPTPHVPESQLDDLDAVVDEILGSKPRPLDWARLTGTSAEECRAALDIWVTPPLSPLCASLRFRWVTRGYRRLMLRREEE